MARAFDGLRWILFLLYAAGGAAALVLAMPGALNRLGLSLDLFSFEPARILGLPWSGLTWLVPVDSVTTLAILMVGYVLNLGLGLMLARDMGR